MFISWGFLLLNEVSGVSTASVAANGLSCLHLCLGNSKGSDKLKEEKGREKMHFLPENDG